MFELNNNNTMSSYTYREPELDGSNYDVTECLVYCVTGVSLYNAMAMSLCWSFFLTRLFSTRRDLFIFLQIRFVIDHR